MTLSSTMSATSGSGWAEERLRGPRGRRVRRRGRGEVAKLLKENASLKKQVDALRSGSPDQTTGPPTSRLPPPGLDAESTPSQPVAAAATAPSLPQQEHPPRPRPRRRRSPSWSPRARGQHGRRPPRPVSTEQAEHLCARRSTRPAASATTRTAPRSRSPRTPVRGPSGSSRRPRQTPSGAGRGAVRSQRSTPSSSSVVPAVRRSSTEQRLADRDGPRLRAFEQQYRSGLKDHLQGQLETLRHVGLEPEGGPERTAPAPAARRQGGRGPGPRRRNDLRRPADDGGRRDADPGSSDTPGSTRCSATSVSTDRRPAAVSASAGDRRRLRPSGRGPRRLHRAASTTSPGRAAPVGRVRPLKKRR